MITAQRCALLVFLVCLGWFAGCQPGSNPLDLRPELPVIVNYRAALVGSGTVLQVSNQTANRLTLTLTVTRGATDKLTRPLDLGPNDRAEIGRLQGWSFQTGDRVVLEHPNYRPLASTTP